MNQQTKKQIFEFIPYDNKKYALLSPLLGAFGILVCLIIYGSIVLTLSGNVSSFTEGLTMIIATIPAFTTISIVMSYVLSLFTLLPTYKKRQLNLWSNGKFWFINSFLGSCVGLLVVVASIWKMGFLFSFMMFTGCFLASMFTSSMYTALITLRFYNTNKE